MSKVKIVEKSTNLVMNIMTYFFERNIKYALMILLSAIAW